MSQGDNQQLFQLLSSLLNEVEALSNEEEVDLRAKIDALKSEVTKVPSQSVQHTDDAELELAKRMDNLSSKLDEVDKMISSTDPEVKALLSSTADVWMPVITATSDERRKFSSSVEDGEPEAEANKSG
ncbi:DEAD-box ATP-dependent RNA helicase 5 [Bienertia sinuspersici]